jgi:hypothetical protein
LCHQLPFAPISALTDNDDEEDNPPDDCRRPAINAWSKEDSKRIFTPAAYRSAQP